MVLTASTASMTLPGPTGSPAARNVRAKCIRLASRRPSRCPCGGVRGSLVTRSGPHRGGFGLDLLENAGGLTAVQPGNVVLVFEQHTQSVVDRVRGQLEYVKLHQGVGPIDRLGNAGKLEQVHCAKFLHKTDDLARQVLTGSRYFALQDLELARRARIIDPVVETAPLQRVVDLAGAVRGDYDDRRMRGVDRADFRDRHLKIGKQLQEICLERLVSAVEF